MMESRSRSIEWSLRFLILYYSDALQCPSRQLNLPITILSPQPIQYPTYQLNPTLFFAVRAVSKELPNAKNPGAGTTRRQFPTPGNPLFSTLFCTSISQPLTSIQPSPHVLFSETNQRRILSGQNNYFQKATLHHEQQLLDCRRS